jgi:hypothetical protein
MKKSILGLSIALLLFAVVPGQIQANSEKSKASVTSTTMISSKAARSEAAEVRLNEIKAMDMSTLSSSEKKELRKEVRAIKSESKANSKYVEGGHGGIYLSAGAVIMLILLLILLL